MDPLEKFLGQARYIHGPGVPEESYYGALEALLNAVGETLDPKVRCVMQIKNTGAGIPDGGFFTADQFSHGGDLQAEALTLPPARGAVEVKSPADDVRQVARGEQVTRYLKKYRQVLVTNLRAFVLMGLDEHSRPMELESYTLAGSEDEFWALAAHPRRAAGEHGERLRDYLARAMLLPAPLDAPKDVAWFLASYAREARARVLAAMEGDDFPAMREIREALEETLGIHFRGRKGDHFFRATLVQTLFYGIFAAWVLWHNEIRDLDTRFDWRVATYHLRVPLIQALFERIAVPSKLKQLDLIEVLNWTGNLLNRVDRAVFFERFGQEHAVQYFYEPFLEAYDPELRKELGVWYTPPEVVEYMVARVDRVLREELGLPDGLADPRVYVLDPCCGTGAYLVEVLERVAATLRAKEDGDALLAQDLKKAAMTRVSGFELLSAPFVVSHLQLGLLLQRWGVPLGEGERAAVYLTNALTGWEPPQEEKENVLSPAFRRERAAAERVKQDAPILVILGNPPYGSFAGVAVGEERVLSEAYRTTKRGPKPRGQGLNDLYVRFYRMAERRIVEQTGRGIVCFISNYSWLDGLSHPGMREHYLEAFDKIWIDNLHGDRIISEYAPDGRVSETIFAIRGSSPGIKLGTAIALLTRIEPHRGRAEVLYRDLQQAKAEDRRAALLENLQAFDFDVLYKRFGPLPELGYPFKPKKAGEGYLDWPDLPDLFPVFFPGVKTSRDEALVDIDREQLVARMKKYFDPSIGNEEIARIAPRLMQSTQRFRAEGVRDYLLKRGFLQDNVVRYYYRPFDVRWLYWEPETRLLDRNRADYFAQVFEGNIWIVSQQKPRREWSWPQIIGSIGCLDLMDRGASCFPLCVREQGLLAAIEARPRPDLSDGAREYLARFSERPEVSRDNQDLEALAKHLFHHALAVLHAPAYCQENAGALRQDWPHIPLPATAEALRASAALGCQVAALLDPEEPVEGVTTGCIRTELRHIAVISRVNGGDLNPAAGELAATAGWGYLGRAGITMPGQGCLTELETEEGLAYDVYLNDVAYWHNVPAEVWDYKLGGYQVLKKWLSYREKRVLGRDLKPEEARTFTAIARRIAAILNLHPELDANYSRITQNVYAWASQ
jgi:hypothetical protein